MQQKKKSTKLAHTHFNTEDTRKWNSKYNEDKQRIQTKHAMVLILKERKRAVLYDAEVEWMTSHGGKKEPLYILWWSLQPK